MNSHAPVLRAEVLQQLAIKPDGVFLDGTFGRGGHSRAILDRLGPDGRVLAIDRDPAAVEVGRELAKRDTRFVIEQESFGRLSDFVARQGLTGRLNGVLLDLGLSSPQLEDPERGFSFRLDGPLDMRMDPASRPSAAEWLASATEQEIARVLFQFGEEKASRRIARAICLRRAEEPIQRTVQLAELVECLLPRRPGGKHPATRTFQAIRIFVNRELEELEEALDQAAVELAPAGRLCVISFHSLEDRMVKRFLRDKSRVDPALADLPVVPQNAMPTFRLPTRVIRPGPAELSANPRARSATLRVGERL